jgi:hypothetical protein
MDPEGDTLRQYANNLVTEAEHQQLLRKLQKTQRLNNELTGEVEAVTRRLLKLRQERKYQNEIVYLMVV